VGDIPCPLVDSVMVSVMVFDIIRVVSGVCYKYLHNPYNQECEVK
jgi:hypothetical protein